MDPRRFSLPRMRRPDGRPLKTGGRGKALRALRVLSAAQALALVAMLLQVLLTADHLGATLAAQAGRAAPGARLGLLEICTGEGIVLMTPDGRRLPANGPSHGPNAPGHSSPAEQCSVCVSASACSFDAPESGASPAIATGPALPVEGMAERPAIRVAARRSATPIRAPPAA